MPRGGARPGSGRPTNASIEAKVRSAEKGKDTFAAKAACYLPEYFETLHRLAVGVWVREMTSEGEERVYKKPPEKQALMFLIEQGIGKAVAKPTVQAETNIQLVANVPRPAGKPGDAFEEEPDEAE